MERAAIMMREKGHGKRTALAMFAGCLAGCVPVITSYYAPSGEGIAVEGIPCSGQLVKDVTLHLPGDTLLGMFVARPENGKSSFPLLANVNVMPSHTVIMNSHDVIFARGNQAQTLIPIASMRSEVHFPVVAIHEHSLLLPMTGGAASTSSNASEVNPTIYSFRVDLPVEDAEQFWVQIPSLTIDGMTIRIPRVTYTKRTGAFIAGFCQ
jgi:hypothetical protein